MHREPGAFPWTAKQRRALVVFLTILCCALLVKYACRSAFLDDPEPDIAPRGAELADHLDPNTATWQELAAIVGLGEKKAKAIVAYREAWHAKHPQMPAFAGPQDLRHIKGIGPATVSNILPFLVFPEPAGTTATRP